MHIEDDLVRELREDLLCGAEADLPAVLYADVQLQKLVESFFFELALAVGNALKSSVVGNDELLILGESDIKFDLIRTERKRRRESGQSVFGH
jgi:hypothetical protein